MILAGIDAGGTTTKCLLMHLGGEILGRSTTGPANLQVVGLEEGVRQVQEALKQACMQACVDRVDILGIGFAGAGRRKDRERLVQKLNGLSLAHKVFLTDDGVIAAYGAYGGKPGLILIAGTGSIAYELKDHHGLERRGGWGPFLGDEGSGFWIGLKALQAVIRAHEGRGMATILSNLIREKLQIQTLEELIPFMHDGSLPRDRVAALSREVVQAREEGDTVAQTILREGIEALAALIHSLGSCRREIVVYGGLFNSPSVFHGFQDSMTGYTVRRPDHDAVFGAVCYGAIQAGIKNFHFPK